MWSKDGAQEARLAAHGAVQAPELLEARHLGEPMSGAPGGDGGELQIDGGGRIGAGLDQGVADLQ